MEGFLKRRKHELETKPHVAIIGAGLAGLRCADVLLQHGFQVSIFEGRDRIGGRLFQSTLSNGQTVDVGPNWIHGTDDNPILALAKQTGTAVGTWDDSTRVFDESGVLLPEKEGLEYSTMLWDIIQEAFEHSNKSSAEIDENLSLLDFFHDKVREKIPETEPDFERKREIALHMSRSWGNFVGSSIVTQSLKFFWLEECLDGENLFCAGTYKKILEVIAKPALEGASVHFNSVVERILYRTDQEHEVKIQLRGGQILSFDEVVTTTPLGWLKRNLDAFEPPLPTRLCQAIGSIGYGCLEKVYISFPRAFWLPSPENNNNGVRGFMHFLTPTYDPASNPKQWNQEIVELASIAPEAAHPTVLFYMYGDQSRHIAGSISKLQSQEEKDKFLMEFFKPYYSRLPNYAESSTDCRPACCLATTWLCDELAGNGSYCNFQVGLSNGDEDIKLMRRGLPDQGLWFAGEHTAPYVALGTVTGAYWSGESVGERIAELYGLSKRKAA